MRNTLVELATANDAESDQVSQCLSANRGDAGFIAAVIVAITEFAEPIPPVTPVLVGVIET